MMGNLQLITIKMGPRILFKVSYTLRHSVPREYVDHCYQAVLLNRTARKKDFPRNGTNMSNGIMVTSEAREVFFYLFYELRVPFVQIFF